MKIIKSHSRFTEQGKIELKILSYLKKNDRIPSQFVSMLEFFNFRNHLCIVFELLSFSLFDLLKANSFQGLSATLVRRFASQLVSGLLFLKSHHIIHCDLKPENILLRNPTRAAIKVIDYGSSCFTPEQIYTYIQSRFYRAPEIMLGIPYTPAIDI